MTSDNLTFEPLCVSQWVGLFCYIDHRQVYMPEQGRSQKSSLWDLPKKLLQYILTL